MSKCFFHIELLFTNLFIYLFFFLLSSIFNMENLILLQNGEIGIRVHVSRLDKNGTKLKEAIKLN